MEAQNIMYNYIEFFFSKEDLKSMMTIKPFSYESWLDVLYESYKNKPINNNTFHYNIMHTKSFENINSKIKEIEKIYSLGLTTENKHKIDILFKQIEEQYKDLHYYEETYLYAHYVFNNIRKNIIETETYKQVGGGKISLEDFKKKIREKIRKLEH